MLGLGVGELFVILVIVAIPAAIVFAVVAAVRWNSSASAVNATVSARAGDDRAAELERLHALKVKGALTEAEFNEQKRRLLS